MKKLVIVVALLFLVVGLCYAGPRNPSDINGDQVVGHSPNDLSQLPTHQSKNKVKTKDALASGATTNVTNIASLGFDTTGNPGFISLAGTDFVGDTHMYYLWVDIDGDLLIASGTTMSRFSSFPTGDWRTILEEHGGVETVGDQE